MHLGSHKMEQLISQIKSVDSLNKQTIQMMFELYREYYDYANHDTFTTDLSNKNNAIIVYHQQKIVGFTTIKNYCINFQGRKIQIIFSGDTIMHHNFWQNPILSTTWLKYAGFIKAQQSTLPLFWLLIVKGHRTYRFLPVYSKVFYPNYRYQTPAFEQSLMDHLSKTIFKDNYIPERGTIHNPYQGQLKTQWAEIPVNIKKREDIRFFLEKNANYVNGDELVCLCELSESNLKPFSRRLFEAGMNNLQQTNIL